MMKRLVLFVVLSVSIWVQLYPDWVQAAPPGITKPQAKTLIHDSLSGLTVNHISSTGATSGQAIVKSGDSATWGNPTVAFENPSIYGDLNLYGNLRLLQNANTVDTVGWSCARADTFLYIKVPPSLREAFTPGDSVNSMHPGSVTIPGGFAGWKHWCMFTKGDDAKEDPYIRVSNDGINWYRYGWGSGAGDSLPDPFVTVDSCKDTASVSAGHLADGDMFFGSNGKLYAVWLAVFNSDTSAIFGKSTSDGQTWSGVFRMSPWFNISESYGAKLSPTVWTDTNGCVKAWLILGNPANEQANYIFLYGASHPDSVWSFLDTVRAPSGLPFPGDVNDSGYISGHYKSWHVKVVENGADNKIVLLSGSDGQDSLQLYAGYTTDGTDLYINHTPILPALERTSTAWDEYPYRATGWWEENSGYRSFRLLYSAMMFKEVGWDSTMPAYATGLTTLYFRGSPAGSIVPGANTIDSSMIKDGSIIAADIKSNSIGQAQIATDGVGAAEIATGAVGTSEIANGGVTNADLSASAVDSNVIPAASISTGTDLNWKPEIWSYWIVEGQAKKKTDSVFMYANLGVGQGASHVSYLIYDSSNTSTNKWDTVYCYTDLPFNMAMDSIVYWYYQTGSTSSAIDTVTLYGPTTASVGKPVADSLWDADNTQRNTATTLTSVLWGSTGYNKNLTKNSRLGMRFMISHAAANSIVGIRRIQIYYKRLQ